MQVWSIKSRPDWFTWEKPDPAWCAQFGGMPGIQATGGNGIIETITFHRSHFPRMPVDVRQLAAVAGAGKVADRVQQRHLELTARGVQLRAYQAQDLPFMMERRGVLLGYEMRLGKTALAAAAHDPADGCLLVAGPLIARDVWRDWITRVHGDPPFTLRGKGDLTEWGGLPAYFCNYDVLEAQTPLLTQLKIGTLILDELHIMQRRGSKRYQAAGILASRAKRVIGLTGTPVWSDPMSLYPTLHLVNPGGWSSAHDFGNRYTNATPSAHGWQYQGRSGLYTDELKDRLHEILLRKTWTDVLGHLPPITRIVEPVEVPAEFAARIDLETSEAIILAASSNHTVAGYLSTLRRKLSKLKLKPAVEAAARAMLDGHSVVVWTWHVDLAEAIAEELAKPKRGRGGVDIMPAFPVYRLRSEDGQNTRADQVARFQGDERPSVMVASLAVGGVAIDLSRGTHSIHAETSTIPLINQQAEMRTFHPSRPSCAVYLAADTPLEMKLIEVLGVREGHAAALDLGEEQIARLVLRGP